MPHREAGTHKQDQKRYGREVSRHLISIFNFSGLKLIQLCGLRKLVEREDSIQSRLDRAQQLYLWLSRIHVHRNILDSLAPEKKLKLTN